MPDYPVASDSDFIWTNVQKAGQVKLGLFPRDRNGNPSYWGNWTLVAVPIAFDPNAYTYSGALSEQYAPVIGGEQQGMLSHDANYFSLTSLCPSGVHFATPLTCVLSPQTRPTRRTPRTRACTPSRESS